MSKRDSSVIMVECTACGALALFTQVLSSGFLGFLCFYKVMTEKGFYTLDRFEYHVLRHRFEG